MARAPTPRGAAGAVGCVPGVGKVGRPRVVLYVGPARRGPQAGGPVGTRLGARARTGWSESAVLWERWQRVPCSASTTSASDV